MCGICAESSDCKESSGKCFCQKMTASRAYGLDQRSNTHDNRLSPTIKCGIEGVTLRSSGTSSSGYVVTTSRLNRYAHAHTHESMSLPFHHHHHTTHDQMNDMQPDHEMLDLSFTRAMMQPLLVTWCTCLLLMSGPDQPAAMWRMLLPGGCDPNEYGLLPKHMRWTSSCSWMQPIQWHTTGHMTVKQMAECQVWHEETSLPQSKRWWTILPDQQIESRPNKSENNLSNPGPTEGAGM